VSVLIEIPDRGGVKNIAEFSVFLRDVNEGFQLVAILLATLSLHMFHFLDHIKISKKSEFKQSTKLKRNKRHK
jgi:hypothetical protein